MKWKILSSVIIIHIKNLKFRFKKFANFLPILVKVDLGELNEEIVKDADEVVKNKQGDNISN